MAAITLVSTSNSMRNFTTVFSHASSTLAAVMAISEMLMVNVSIGVDVLGRFHFETHEVILLIILHAAGCVLVDDDGPFLFRWNRVERVRPRRYVMPFKLDRIAERES